MGVFSKVFKGKDGRRNDINNKTLPQIPQKPTWIDAWTRTTIQPEEIHELSRGCTVELKNRGLDVPFLLLPFRPASDLSATRTFIRNYFGPDSLKSDPPRAEQLLQELRLTEPLVIAGVLKWCWSRLPGGVVTWEAYELFKIGEHDSDFAPNAFTTFIPISVGSGARSKIIFDFFDLFAAIAAHGKANGFGGRKLSRYAAWWAFEFGDNTNGFEGGYKTWAQSADATSHLFFAYLRSVSPSAIQNKSILGLPRALQHLLDDTEYPPVSQPGLHSRTSKVVMIVDSVSPTPFALLRRAKDFHYREGDTVLYNFSGFEDPIAALTNECKRVLKSISSANESTTAKHSTSLRDASWSRFEDIGFGALSGDFESADDPEDSTLGRRPVQYSTLKSQAASKVNDAGRPTTPSWADFMSSGFQEQIPNGHPSVLLPPDQILPPIATGTNNPQAAQDDGSALEPGELANISSFDLDDTFWWVWMTSLAGEEPPERKAAFGRCAMVETKFGNQWIVIEEIIKGAAPEPDANAYVAEKKSRFGFSTRRKLTRSKSNARDALPKPESNLSRSKTTAPMSSKTSIAPDQHARIQAAAAALQEKNRSLQDDPPVSPRRGRIGEDMNTKTSSTITLQPFLMNEAAPALQWANKYDKSAIRAKYLGDSFAGRGSNTSLINNPPVNATSSSLEATANGSTPFTNGVDGVKNKENRPLGNRGISPEPRDEGTRPPSSNQALIEVLQNGPPGSKPLQTPTNRKAIPLASQESASAAPRVPSKEILAPGYSQHHMETTDKDVQRDQVPAAADKPQESTSAIPEAVNKPLPPPAAEAPLTAAPIQVPRSAPAPVSVSAPAPMQIPPQTPPKATAQATAVSRAPLATMSTPRTPGTPDGRPLSPETSRKLQKKQGQSGGFKGIFSRKKKDEPLKDITARKPVANASSVAAARAALEAKAAESQKAPEPPTRVTSKRFSTVPIQPEPMPESAPVASEVEGPPTSGPEITENPPAPLPKDTPKLATEEPLHEPKKTQSIIDEEKRAEHEFSSFDQGPLQEAPVFAPVDTPVVSRQSPTHKSSLPSEEHDVSPLGETPPPTVIEEGQEKETAPAVAPAEVPAAAKDEIEEPVVSPNDRWAQIRKNAAERVALTKQEDSQVAQGEEDGETSGEETIESRVARIKARVAELTGNMDLPNNRH